ncbi:MAG TPA: beta-carotene hydroxylase [Chromatiales bacterium]|nr:beta-carotene hydroxylase [Chromatiales bacterium]
MTSLIVDLLLFVAAFAGMEGVAYLTHKYVMHGWLWSLHESHHRPRDGIFEKNDLFAFYFALPSILLIWLGVNVNHLMLPIGLGMTAYGLCYFAFHDGIVHRRLPLRYRGRNPYMKRIIQAHYVHHATTTKEGAVSFGFLYTRPVAELDAERRRLERELRQSQTCATDQANAAASHAGDPG